MHSFCAINQFANLVKKFKTRLQLIDYIVSLHDVVLSKISIFLDKKKQNTDVICTTCENNANNTQTTPLFTSRRVIVLSLNLGNGSDLVPHSNFHVTVFTF